MPKSILTALKAATASALACSTIAMSPFALAQPAPGGNQGPAILVPTDVTGTQIELVESSPTSVSKSKMKIGFEKFPQKFNCKKILIEEDTGTKRSELSSGTITLDAGKILVAPVDGQLLVRTKFANVAVPKDGIALIGFVSDRISIFNLGGRELVVHLPEEGVPHHKSNYDQCIGLAEGFGIITNGPKDSIASGVLQYVGHQASSSVVIAVGMRNCKLVVIDPMRILQQDSIMKLLMAEKWLSVLKK